MIACSRRSDSGARTKKKASERAGKKRGETGEEDEGSLVLFRSLPSFFPPLSLALFFARAPLSERLEQRVDVILTLSDAIASFCEPQRKHLWTYYLPFKILHDCHSLNVIRFWRRGGGGWFNNHNLNRNNPTSN